MWKLTRTATAGFILNVAMGKGPGPLSPEERDHLRSLARRVAELAADPKQRHKRDLWYRHIALEPVRPLLLVFLEDAWEEVLPIARTVRVRDPFWGQYEWYLSHLLFRDERLADDFVIEPDLYVDLPLRMGDWGLKPAEYAQTDPRGSYRWTPPLANPDDIRKLRPASIDADVEAAQQRLAAVREVFGDILPVRLDCNCASACLVDVATHLRGIQQFMLDVYDRPEWVHELMAFLSGQELRKRRFLEDHGLLTLNNRNHYVDSGGIGYTNELPAGGFDGRKVRLRDLWCHAAAQAASEIGPEQHEEFILAHELPVLSLAGLNAYGCCEPYTNKFDMLKRRVPRLRRVSVSPWCDVRRAAAELQDKYVLSWKPNPALLLGRFDPEKLRPYVRAALEATRDCRVEIILKDTITLDNEPRRVEEFIRVVREEIGRLWA